MKIIGSFSIIVAMFLCLVNVGISQELAKIVSSPKALHIEAEILDTKNQRIAVSQAIPGLPKAANKLNNQQSKSNDSLAKIGVGIYVFVHNDIERLKQFAKRDSLENRIRVLRLAYAAEMLGESQAVLKKMQEAMESDDIETATKVKEGYIQSLKVATLEKLRSKDIDTGISDAEIKSIDKINNALGMLGYFSAIINSPKASHLEADIEKLRAQRKKIEWEALPLRTRFNEVVKELGELRKQESESNDVSVFASKRKSLETERAVLSKQRDSVRIQKTDPLAERAGVLYGQYSKEITRTSESQMVLKKMQEAMESGDSETALKISREHFISLKHAVQEKLRLRQIDIETYGREIGNVFKIENALSHLAFHPVK